MVEGYPLQPGGVHDYPVKLGSMLLTLVDPHRGYERAYNRWYERDHFYAGCMVGPYNFAGSRWVAPRRLKDLRWGGSAVADPIDAGSYLAVYWVEAGHHKEWDEWALPQVRALYADGRGFAERSHVHTATFDHLGAHYRDSDPVPVELALDHHYDSLVVVWLDGIDGLAAPELHGRLRPAVRTLLADSPIEIASSWTPRPEFRNSRDNAPMSLGSPGGGENRLCQLFFCAGEVTGLVGRFRAYTDALSTRGLAETRLGAPFVRTRVGTDEYVDQLW